LPTVADLTLMTSRIPASSAFGPTSATLLLLAAGPLTIWSLVMFLLCVTGEVDLGFASSKAGPFGLLVFSFMGALACRRAINVLRARPGGAARQSRIARAVMLIGIVAVAQVPVTMWANQSFNDTLSGPILLLLIGGLAAAMGGGIASLWQRRT
jgi:hypothetical protein